MKRFVSVIAIMFALGFVGLHLHRCVYAYAQSGSPLLHKQSSFDISVKGPYSQVAPLFGAEGERAWGGADWDPHFVYPSPAQDVPGAVFTVEHGGHKTLWITPIYDLAGRHIQHLVILPDMMVTQLDITFPQSTSDVTHIHVAYQRTALSSPFNEHVERLAAHDATQAPEWQKAIDEYLISKKH